MIQWTYFSLPETFPGNHRVLQGRPKHAPDNQILQYWSSKLLQIMQNSYKNTWKLSPSQLKTMETKLKIDPCMYLFAWGENSRTIPQKNCKNLLDEGQQFRNYGIIKSPQRKIHTWILLMSQRGKARGRGAAVCRREASSIRRPPLGEQGVSKYV